MCVVVAAILYLMSVAAPFTAVLTIVLVVAAIIITGTGLFQANMPFSLGWINY